MPELRSLKYRLQNELERISWYLDRNSRRHKLFMILILLVGTACITASSVVYLNYRQLSQELNNSITIDKFSKYESANSSAANTSSKPSSSESTESVTSSESQTSATAASSNSSHSSSKSSSVQSSVATTTSSSSSTSSTLGAISSQITVKVKAVVYYGGHYYTQGFDYQALIANIKTELTNASIYKNPGAIPNVRFQVVQTQVINNTAPQLGYNCDQYLPKVQDGNWTSTDWQNTNCWGSGTANYNTMLTDSQACELANNGTIDEVWFFGFGNGGFWEANMAGPGAFWTNGPVVTGTTCTKAMHIMGFNYQLPAEYAMHSFGHRVEGVMYNYLAASFGQFNIFGSNPSCGNVHFPPNGTADYDYGNTSYVSSDCLNWNPQHTGARASINCTTWGCSQLGYMRWWLRQIPGSNNGLKQSNGSAMPNWWKLITKNSF